MIRVLLADDHTITREGTRRLLEAEADFAIAGEAADGDEAIRLVQQLRPDVLVLDVSMPGRDGIAVAREIREWCPETKIVVLTGHGDNPQYARALLRLGVRGYLAKTVAARELVAAIRSVAAGGRYLRGEIVELTTAAAEVRASDLPTARELEVLRLVAAGLRNRDIAQRLGLRERTVQFHLGNLFTKFGATSRTELVHRAHRAGLLD